MARTERRRVVRVVVVNCIFGDGGVGLLGVGWSGCDGGGGEEM